MSRYRFDRRFGFLLVSACVLHTDALRATFWVTSIGEAGAGLLTVTQIIDEPSAVPTRFYVTAGVAGEAAPTTSLEYFDSGAVPSLGQLSIQISGADSFTYSSPTFLTVPEAEAGALATVASSVLAALARGRRS